MKRTLVILALLLCLCGLAAAEEIAIVNVDASSWIEGKDPSAYVPYRMIDGAETTAFQFSTKTTPLGKAYVYFYLAAPSEVSALWIKNGFWKITDGLDQYTRNSRVKSMAVAFQYDGSTHYTDAQTITLPDDKSRQDWTRVNLGSHPNVVSVRFQIKSIYQGSKYKNDVCISEVRFVGSGAPSSSAPTGALYGLAKQKLATRSGPGTTYSETGTYNVAGQYIRVLSRAWDSRNEIWWVKCEIPYRNEIRVLWTGYKRFDASTLPLESIPIEGQGGGMSVPTVPPVVTAPPVVTIPPVVTAPPSAGGDWSSVFRAFVMEGQYRYDGMFVTDMGGEAAFALYDMDGNGVPELLMSNGDESMAGKTNLVYAYIGGRAEYAGDAGFRESEMQYYPGSPYPGLFCMDGNMGYYQTEYYTLVNGSAINQEDVVAYQYYPEDDPYTWLEEPIVQPLTGDDALYALVTGGMQPETLTMYTVAQINAMGGWDAFAQPFLGGAAADPRWRDVYRAFILSDTYRVYLYNPDPELHQMLKATDPQDTDFALFDLDGDGTPELLVQTFFGPEQIDVFTVVDGYTVLLGTMGGDNFFQDVFWLPGRPGLITLMGGPAMEIDRYTVQDFALVHTPVGRTLVDDNGESTVGVQMNVIDGSLYQQLYNKLVRWQPNVGASLTWKNRSALQSAADWSAFWATLPE